MPYNYFNLQLFGEEGDMAGSVDGSSGIASTGAENTSIEGVATQDTVEQVAPAQDQIPTESWDDLIKGRYKKEYNAAVKDAVAKRFKNQRDLQGQIDKIDPMMRALAQKYGVNPEADGSLSIDAITKSVMDDNSMYEQEAFQRGMSVQDLKQLKQLEAENMQLKRVNARTQEQQEWDGIVAQGNDLKQTYPEFDLDTEMQDPQFGRLLATFQKSGFPNSVRTAYEAIHRDEIMGGAMRYAVQQTEQKISNSIQSGMRRPVENGTSHQSAAAVSDLDPSKFTKADFDDMKRRAERGERITF